MDKKQESQKKSVALGKPSLILVIFRLIFKYVGAVFPALIGRWAYWLWFRTDRGKIPKREFTWIENAKVKPIDINGLAVMTYSWENSSDKSAPLVMLLHGWTGRGSQMGAFAAPLVEAGFRVLAFDNHAHNNTAGNSTHFFKQSEIQCGLAEKVGEIYAVVTHSFGGMVTPYSLTHGMSTQKMVCISPPTRFNYLLERFSRILQLPKSIQDYMAKRFEKEYGSNLEQRVSGTSNVKELGHIPALIIHDEEDIDVPISESELLHQAWPNSQLKRTKGLGHRRILYNAEVVANTVKFIKG